MNCINILLAVLLFQLTLAVKLGDPYNVLEISKSANQQDIKKAFKKMAKIWHPDKNSSPEAEDTFIQISEAYKLLSDVDRRRLYDSTGQTEETPTNWHGGRRSSMDSFEEMFSNTFGGNGGFRFTYREDGNTYYAKSAINKGTYEATVVPESRHRPFVLLFYSEWCVACAHVQPIWRRLVAELEPVNFAMHTVHAGLEPDLCRRVGVKTVPYMIMVLDGHPYHYTAPALSMAAAIDFVRGKFPHKLVIRVTETNVKDFLAGWRDNKVRILLFGRLDIIRLRYLTIAWEFKGRANVGYVQMGRPDTESIRRRFNVATESDALLVFQDNEPPADATEGTIEGLPSSIASVTMKKDLSYTAMRDVIFENRFLILPRLSSQDVLDEVCPAEASAARRALCVVLVTRDHPDHDGARSRMRAVAAADPRRRLRKLQYTYIFRERQQAFIRALTDGEGSDSASDLHVAIIWRRSRRSVSYEWVSERWEPDEPITDATAAAAAQNASKLALEHTLHKLLYTDQPMPFQADIQELLDEHAQNIVWRVINRLSNIHDYLREKLSADDLVPAISVLATVLFILVGGYVMSYLVKLEEEKINEKKMASSGGKSAPLKPQLRIHELRGETYNGLVRLLKPGCRTIVLLCDSTTKTKLMPKFHKAAWPYRKNKTLMFCFVNTDRPPSLTWYTRILSLGLLESRPLNINPKNAIGTVLALNGHRKYFCIYHAKHPETSSIASSLSSISSDGSTVRKRRSRVGSSGDLMGFSDSDSDEAANSDLETGNRATRSAASNKPLLKYYSSIVFEDQLLDGLSMWMDRLFEGSTTRYYVNYWPDWPGK